jgi:hypothetical protein
MDIFLPVQKQRDSGIDNLESEFGIMSTSCHHSILVRLAKPARKPALALFAHVKSVLRYLLRHWSALELLRIFLRDRRGRRERRAAVRPRYHTLIRVSILRRTTLALACPEVERWGLICGRRPEADTVVIRRFWSLGW